MASPLRWLPCLVAGCLAGSPPTSPDTSGDTDTVDTPVGGDHTDTLPAVDSEPTDTSPPVDPWIDALVDVTGPIDAAGALTPDVGHPEDPAIGGPQLLAISFGDLDEDGDPEIVVGAGVFATAGVVGHRTYRWRGGEVQPAPEIDAALPAFEDAIVGLVDLDGDHHLDLLSSRLRSAIAFGHGDGTFSEPLAIDPDAIPYDDRQIAPWDVDGDGWLDLMVGDGCTRGLYYLLRTGERTWTPQPASAQDAGPAVSAAAILPIPTAAGTIVYTAGRACPGDPPPTGFYTLIEDDEELPRVRQMPITVTDPSWVGLPEYVGAVSSTEIEPMGASTVDLDGDGRQDVLLALSLRWVATWLQQPDGSFLDASHTFALTLPQALPIPGSPWGIGPLDLDRDGDDDLVVAMGDDATEFGLLQGSPIRNAVFRNGPAGYDEVAVPSGLDAIGSFHTVVPTDLDHDGEADFGLGGFGSRPRVIHNELRGGGGIAIRLVGTTSNHLGYGAVVDVVRPRLGTTSRMLVRPAQLGSTPEPIVFAGLGDDPEATVRVHWPSGLVQEVHHVVPGPVTIVEPELLTVSPPSRHVPSDGVSTATIRVVPRASDGSPRAAREVVVSAQGTRIALTRDGDAWVAELRGRLVPGRVRIDVSVDGVIVDVHPVIWWDPR